MSRDEEAESGGDHRQDLHLVQPSGLQGGRKLETLVRLGAEHWQDSKPLPSLQLRKEFLLCISASRPLPGPDLQTLGLFHVSPRSLAGVFFLQRAL